MNSSVAVIGGADGPTAIFVAGSPLGLILPVLGIVAIGGIAVCLWRKRKK